MEIRYSQFQRAGTTSDRPELENFKNEQLDSDPGLPAPETRLIVSVSAERVEFDSDHDRRSNRRARASRSRKIR
jgi:hypothetical protein